MTTQPTAFQFQESHPVRVVMLDGEPWFVATDVCAALDIANPSRALSRLDEDEADLHTMKVRSDNGIDQDREVNIINESGLYSLILTSRKPEAKKFKKWVTSEVLPTIRKTGRYVHQEPQDRPLTQQERRAVSEAVANITRYLRFLSNSQSVAFVYGLMCDNFGIDKTEQLTPHQLNTALAFLRTLGSDAHHFYMEQHQREKEWCDNKRRTLSYHGAQDSLTLN